MSELDPLNALIARLLTAAKDVRDASWSGKYDTAKAGALREHLRDQCVAIGRLSGIPPRDLLDFVDGQNESIARILALRVGTGLVNSFGYEVEA